jgi:hypothetical protein
VDGHVLAQIVAGDLHHAVVGATPGAGGRPVSAGDDDAPGTRQDVLRAIALGHLLAEGFDRGDADHARAGLEADRFDLLLRCHEGPRIIPSDPLVRLNHRELESSILPMGRAALRRRASLPKDLCPAPAWTAGRHRATRFDLSYSRGARGPGERGSYFMRFRVSVVPRIHPVI